MSAGMRRFPLAALLAAAAFGFCVPGIAAEPAAGAGSAPGDAPAEQPGDAPTEQVGDVTRAGPVKMVRQTSNAVLDLISEAQGYAKQDPERFYKQVESLLSPVVDFKGFARSVMGAYYKKATPEQFSRFAETFKWGLVRTYALALTDFNDGKVVVVPPDHPPRNPERQTVKMEIRTAAGEVYPVLYSVVQEDDGRWQIRNLIVNGVNMGLTYRNQFNSAMNNPKYGGDMDKVIDSWGELLKEQKKETQDSMSKDEDQQA